MAFNGLFLDFPAVLGFNSWQPLLILLPLFLVILLNVKVLPFAWHVRLFYGYFRHFYFDRRPLPSSSPSGLPTLFQATIYTNKAPLFELDYNLHKSNSTYLTDLDIARGHHLYCLFREGFHKFNSPNAPPIPIPEQTSSSSSSLKPNARGPFYPALGGVTCTFKREITPYTPYEIWTRVLSWDTKWVYLISHFVEKGAGAPVVFSDQPWRGAERSKSENEAVKARGASKRSVIYASCISKYAFKKGRITVPPAIFLEACNLLPSVNISEGLEAKDTGTRTVIKAKKEEGMKVAQAMAGLDEGLEFYSQEEEVVFAKY
ncbi:hypothetical protein N7462_001831 [Penicillium macrosclerotiorum]|uniref:uncharacterized protein n=1 Tax=Penicillium macrosclerotiorum TaxID=303699 RepID=UPI00254841B4|nr:uncharacterized protein N7462_001831 [Penicillium macrosclerotiorum]KAJ5692408.1 hypothetical protein N7462_001831 [Penicillium macrosclerotiorum]